MTRYLTGALALVAALGLAACSSKTPTAGSTTAAGATAAATTGAPASSVQGEPVGSTGDPCLLITPADIKAALNENVTSSKRLKEDIDAEDGNSQQCAYVTDAPGMGGPGAAALMAMGSAFSGGKPQAAPTAVPAGAIGVTIKAMPKAVTKADMETDQLPPGAKLIDLPDGAAMLLPMPSQGGVVFAGKGKKGVIIMDLEGRKVSLEELQKLLDIALARL